MTRVPVKAGRRSGGLTAMGSGAISVRVNWKRLVVAIVLVVGVIQVYIVVTGADLSRIGLPELAYSAVLVFAGWVVSVFRLMYIVESNYNDVNCSFKTYLKARFLGDLLAKITPSAIGGEPARALLISSESGLSIGTAYALAIYEVSYDVIYTCLLGLFFSMWYLPYSIPVILVSGFVVVSWPVFFRSVSRVASKFRANYVAVKLAKFTWFEKLFKHIEDFGKTYSEISSTMDLGSKLFTWILTVLIHCFWALAIAPFLYFQGRAMNPVLGLWTVFSAYSIMQAISMLPTPGGVGVAEYGLSLVLPPEVVVAYRIIYYFVPIASALFILAGELLK
jgi:uncharacterized protein (TIRG00374 family)